MSMTKEELIALGDELTKHPQLVLHRDRRDTRFIGEALAFLKALPKGGRKPKLESGDRDA